MEKLEDRTAPSATTSDPPGPLPVGGSPTTGGLVLDASTAGQAAAPAPGFVPGEILVGFVGPVADLYQRQGPGAALQAAQRETAPFGLSHPRALMYAPAAGGQAAQLITRWLLPAGANPAAAADQLQHRPGVAYAEPNHLLGIQRAPNDPRYGELWGLNNTGQTGGTPDADIDAPEAWATGRGGTKVVAGVVDTGLDYRHPDLYRTTWLNQAEIPSGVRGNLSDTDGDGLVTFHDLNHVAPDGTRPNQGTGKITDLNGNGYIDADDLLRPAAQGGWADGIDGGANGYTDDLVGWDFANGDNNPFDDNGHGTHVSGTIAAAGDDGVGVAGVNWSAQVMPLKFLGAGGGGDTADAVSAINYATAMRRQGVNIVLTNNSWGGGSSSKSLQKAIQDSGTAGLLFVAAAGNGNTNTDASPSYPASYTMANIVSVAATDHGDNRASFSNYGATSVDLAAPGVNILSTTPDNAYSAYNGTSMAAPHVAGVAALAWSLFPAATYQQVRDAIFSGVDKVGSMAGITVTGGRLNAVGTLARLGMVVTASTPAAGGIVSGTMPTQFTVRFSFPATSSPPADNFTVNGSPADGVTLSPDGLTATFSFGASPVAGDGLYTMSLAAGAVTTTSATPLDKSLKQWSTNFRYDAVRMSVASTQLIGQPDTPQKYTLRVTLNEPCDPSTVSPGDLTLSRGKVTSAAVSSLDNTVIDYTITGLAEGPWQVRLAAGVLADIYGNPSEPYFAAFKVDVGTAAFPGTLQSVLPQGSLIYRGTAAGLLNSSAPAFVSAGSGGLDSPTEMVVGPDGRLYVSSLLTDQVLRYDPTTGSFIDVFVPAGRGGLDGPRGLAFGPDGHLYVAGSFSDKVLVFNGASGALVKDLDANRTGGLDFPTGLAFSPGGQLVVSSNATNQVLRYDPAKDDFVVFVAAGSGGLGSPQGLAFGPDGHLYVATYSSAQVLRYSGSTGAFINEFVAARSGGLSSPIGLAFADTGTGAGQELHVTSHGTSQVLRYHGSQDPQAGKFLDAYVQQNDGGLSGAVGVVAVGGTLYVGSPNTDEVLRFDGTRGATPGDADTFTIPLDANQTAAVRVTSTANVSVVLTHTAESGVVTTYTPAPGQAVAVTTAALPAGTFAITVTAPDALTERRYSVDLVLNALLEREPNNATAQPLAAGTLDLGYGLGLMDRTAVLGTVGRDIARIFEETEPNLNDLRGSWDMVPDQPSRWGINLTGNPKSPLNRGVFGSIKRTGSTSSPSYDGSDQYRFDARAGDVVTVRSWGSNSGGGTLTRGLVNLLDASGVQLAVGTAVSGAASDFEITSFTIPADGTYRITLYSDQKVSGTYTLTLDLNLAEEYLEYGPPRGDGADLHSLTVPSTGATPLPVVLTADPRVQLQLVGPDGTAVLGTSAAQGGYSVLRYDAATPGKTYTVRVTMAAGLTAETVPYALVAVVNGAVDAGANNTPAAAQDITGLHGVIGHAGGVLVGYYTDYNPNTTAPAAAIAAAGYTPVQITDIAGFNFDGVDMLLVNEASNSGLSDALKGRLPAIQAWVNAGGVFIVHDRFVSSGPAESNPFLLGRPEVKADRDFANGADLDVIPPDTPVTDGPAGRVTNTTLDGGNYSNHGFVVGSTLKATDTRILSAGPDPGNVAAFSYALGTGRVYYSTIPLDWYLGGTAGLAGAFSTVYTPNVVSYGNSRRSTQADEDWYAVTVPVGAGDVAYETRTPGDGPGQFVNTLNPAIEVYVAVVVNGVTTYTPLAEVNQAKSYLDDGRNERVVLPAGGTYYIRVTAEGGTKGEYVLVDPPVQAPGESLARPALLPAVSPDPARPSRAAPAEAGVLVGPPAGGERHAVDAVGPSPADRPADGPPRDRITGSLALAPAARDPILQPQDTDGPRTSRLGTARPGDRADEPAVPLSPPARTRQTASLPEATTDEDHWLWGGIGLDDLCPDGRG